MASDPIVIPAPDNFANARMNFWILPHLGISPLNEREHEVVIQSFQYIPAD